MVATQTGQQMFPQQQKQQPQQINQTFIPNKPTNTLSLQRTPQLITSNNIPLNQQQIPSLQSSSSINPAMMNMISQLGNGSHEIMMDESYMPQPLGWHGTQQRLNPIWATPQPTMPMYQPQQVMAHNQSVIMRNNRLYSARTTQAEPQNASFSSEIQPLMSS